MSAVKRISGLGSPPWPTSDPFLFCVYHKDNFPKGEANLGPARDLLRGRHIGSDFSSKEGWSMYHGDTVPGFPAHPHRGFETITVTRKGIVDHADSMGCAGRFGEGDTQWMTAGKGISHSEMMPLLNQDKGNPLELFQIWINLKKSDKMAEPCFKMLWADEIPSTVVMDAAGKQTTVTLYAGALGDQAPPAPPPNSWAAYADSHVAVWTLLLQPGATYTLPACACQDAEAVINRTLYFFQGKQLRVDGQAVAQSPAMVDLRASAAVELKNDGAEACELLMLQGRAINERVVQHGPFVMSSQAEIQQAFRDYQATDGFGKWQWKCNDPNHGAKQGRFAKYADGTVVNK